MNPEQVREVMSGLSCSQKTLSPKFLYDKRGSELFEQICQLDAYYPTRAEHEILLQYAPAIANRIGAGALVIEPGSGAAVKIRHLLDHIKHAVAYVPVEIDREILERSVSELRFLYPRIPIFPISADFTEQFEVPVGIHCWDGRKVVYFPGSTIGNFTPQEAVNFMGRMAELVGEHGAFIAGIDLKKDPVILKRAYDDPEGVTSEFNLNLLARLNREAEADFCRENFFHEALYNPELGRVEMHLVSKCSQAVKIQDTVFEFQSGETIHTENSYKYSVDEFAQLASKANFQLREWWTDRYSRFAVTFFERG